MILRIDMIGFKNFAFKVHGGLLRSPQVLQHNLTIAMNRVVNGAIRNVKSRFNTKSGHLGMINVVTSPTATGASSRILGSTSYSRIQEFGGQTKPHEIRPRFKRALAFRSDTWRTPGASSAPGISGPMSNRKRIGPRGKFRGILSRPTVGTEKTIGYAVLQKVNHPGSKIMGRHYTRDAFVAEFEMVKQAILRSYVEAVKG
jgi:hypothetical protein